MDMGIEVLEEGVEEEEFNLFSLWLSVISPIASGIADQCERGRVWVGKG